MVALMLRGVLMLRGGGGCRSQFEFIVLRNFRLSFGWERRKSLQVTQGAAYEPPQLRNTTLQSRDNY
jgi:hypothetical protein